MRNLFILALLSFLPLICNAKGLSVEKKETLAAIAKNDTIRLWNINENHSCELAQMPKEEVEFYLEEVYKNYRLRYKTLVKNKDKEGIWFMHHEVGNIVKRVAFFEVDCDKKLMKKIYNFWDDLMETMWEINK